MPSIGKNHFLTRLIHSKTKIKIEDIVDLFKVLPECLAEAFYEANQPEKKPVFLGAASVYWKKTGLGPSVVFKHTKTFKSRMQQLKYEKMYPLAALHYEMMPEISKKRVTEKAIKGRYLINYRTPDNRKRRTVYATKAAENRIKLQKKVKAQNKLLANK